MMGQIYDDEWTQAFEDLESKSEFKDKKETEIINLLSDLLKVRQES